MSITALPTRLEQAQADIVADLCDGLTVPETWLRDVIDQEVDADRLVALFLKLKRAHGYAGLLDARDDIEDYVREMARAYVARHPGMAAQRLEAETA